MEEVGRVYPDATLSNGLKYPSFESPSYEFKTCSVHYNEGTISITSKCKFDTFSLHHNDVFVTNVRLTYGKGTIIQKKVIVSKEMNRFVDKPKILKKIENFLMVGLSEKDFDKIELEPDVIKTPFLQNYLDSEIFL